MNRSRHIFSVSLVRLCSLLSLVILLLSACGTLEVGIESSQSRSSISAQDTGVVPTPPSTALTSINTPTPPPNTPTPPVILSSPKDLEPLSPMPTVILSLPKDLEPLSPTPTVILSLPKDLETLSPTLSPTPTATPIPVSPTPDIPAPQVLSFAAERVETEEGEGIALTWEAGGEKATICPLIDETIVGCRCLFDVPLAGSRVIQPSEVIGSYSGFQLAVEVGGIRTVRFAPLTVECPDHFADWFFDSRAPRTCPKDPPLSSYAVAQRFEHGLMIWMEALDVYYVLLDHNQNVADSSQGSSSLTSLRIVQGPLELKPGASADTRVAEPPPPNHFEPVSGFGLVWRGEVLGGEGIRAALGWAVEPEYGFDTVYQCAMSCGSDWHCYLQGPKSEIFHFSLLLHFGRFWEVVG